MIVGCLWRPGRTSYRPAFAAAGRASYARVQFSAAVATTSHQPRRVENQTTFFTDPGGVTWTVREADTTRVPGARGPRCLIFETAGYARRAWTYPPDWRTLGDEALLLLMFGG